LKAAPQLKKWRARKAKPMAAEDFFTRWGRRRDEARSQVAAPAVPASEEQGRAVVAPPAAAQALDQPAPTMEDVGALTHDSDYSRFVARDVDENIKRSAMKKLFSNPHFNVMDGLDTYIEDYNSFEPISLAMLQSLNHAKSLLDPLSQLEKPVMELIRKVNLSVGAISPGNEELDAGLIAPEIIENDATPDATESEFESIPMQVAAPALDAGQQPAPSPPLPKNTATHSVLPAILPEPDNDNPI
jgi:hypothetical protein